jgi:hypothetical protein
MRTREDIEAYLMRSGLPYEEVGESGGDMWVVSDSSSGENLVIRLAGPLVLFRVKVLELATVKRKPELFERLLEFNASDMVHGSYGIADGNVVLTCALRLQNLDFNEFQGTIDDFSLALSNHYETLASFRDAA